VGAPRGGSRISGWRDDGAAEGGGPKRGAIGAKRRNAEGIGSREGRRSPSPVCGFGGIAPENFRNLTCKSVHFDAFLCLSQTLNLMQHVLILEV